MFLHQLPSNGGDGGFSFLFFFLFSSGLAEIICLFAVEGGEESPSPPKVVMIDDDREDPTINYVDDIGGDD